MIGLKKNKNEKIFSKSNTVDSQNNLKLKDVFSESDETNKKIIKSFFFFEFYHIIKIGHQ